MEDVKQATTNFSLHDSMRLLHDCLLLVHMLLLGTSTHARKLSVREMSVESFSNDDGDGNENVKKAIGLLSKTTSLHVHHAFLYISLPLLHHYDMKMPSFTFYGGRKTSDDKLFSP